MKDITISRRSLLVSAGLLALARSPDAAATLVPALPPPVPTTPSAFCSSPSTPHSMPPTTALSRPSRRAALRSKIDQKNAQNDQSTCKSIADKFVGDNVNLIYAIATPAAQAAAGATADIPIVGCAITDYAASGLVQDNDKPGTNVTGASDITPVAEQLEMMQKVLPDVKKLACSTAPPSPTPTSRSKAAKRSSISWASRYTDFTVSSSNEIQSVVESAVGKVDALYSPPTTPSPRVPRRSARSRKENKLPFVTGEGGYVHGRRPFHPPINYEDLGYAAGEMAVKDPEGRGQARKMPIKHLSSRDLVVVKNDEMAEALGIDLSALDA